jgi:hypothetical protein
MNGVRVVCHPPVTNFIDAIDASMKACKHTIWAKSGGKKAWDRRDEPPWHQPATLMDSCKEIGCSHLMDIQAAFSVPTRVFGDLTKFRNFYAHRNEITMTAAVSLAGAYSMSTMEHPTQVLSASAYGRIQPIILDWIDDVHNVIGLLCQ